MNNIILFAIIMIIEALPAIFVFSIIGKQMKKNTKAKRNIPKIELILSWTIFIVYAIIFLSIIPLFALGYKKLGLIAFILIASIILLLVIIGAISDLTKKRRFDRQVKYETTGKIVSARLIRTKDVEETGREPKHISYYLLTIEYKNQEGKTKYAETLATYTLSQIAYLNSFKYVNIQVEGKDCIIDANANLAPEEYKEEDLKNIKMQEGDIEIYDNQDTAKEVYNREKSAISVTLLPLIFVTAYGGFSLIKDNVTLAITLFVISAIMISLCISVWCWSNRAIKTLKKGTSAYAIKFKPVGETNAIDTFYDIQYTYTAQNGKVKTKTERVMPDVYEKIQHCKKLPIKVYKDKANIDIDNISIM